MHRGDAGDASMYSTPNELQFDVVERFQICLFFSNLLFFYLYKIKRYASM